MKTGDGSFVTRDFLLISAKIMQKMLRKETESLASFKDSVLVTRKQVK